MKKAANSREMILQAEGLACLSCAEDMENILKETEGILAASVIFRDERIHVKYNAGVLDRKEVFAAVRRLGYRLKIISET